MSWYRTGAVNVTNGNATVRGTGTAWNGNVIAGQAFQLEGSPTVYEVTNVISDTEIEISPPYLGATQAGQSYVIIPVVGLVKRASDAMEGVITRWSQFTGGPLNGRFDDGDALAPGIGFKDDGDTGFFRTAANQIGAACGGVRRWLLSATAFEINVPVTGSAVQSGAGDHAAGKLALAAHTFGPGNLLGAVAQSGGTPTGAVIERGENANGDFVRFADGTQICYSPVFSGDATTARGAAYQWAANQEWTYPVAFSGQGAVYVVPASSNNTQVFGVAAGVGLTDCDVNVVSLSSLSGRSCRFIAHGVWF